MDERTNVNDRMRAGRLRRRVRNGRRKLTKDELEWLTAYERSHPGPACVLPPPVDARQLPLLVTESAEEDEEEDEEDEDEESGVVDTAPPAARMATVEADMYGHGANLLVRAVEMHERVSDRAMAMLERIAEMNAQQSQQVVDMMSALAESRAAAIEHEAGVDDGDDGERTARLESMLGNMVGPALQKFLPAQPVPQKPPGQKKMIPPA